MAKIILSFAIAFLAVMTVFASAAEAGPKVRFGIGSVLPLFTAQEHTKSYSQKSYKKKRVYRSTKKRRVRLAKKRIVKHKTTTQKVETAKTAPIKTETDSQNSTISATSLDNDEIVETEVEVVDESRTTKTEAGNGKSSISTASAYNDETVEENAVEIETNPKDEPATTTNRDVGCKKYFATVGMSLTVACE